MTSRRFPGQSPGRVKQATVDRAVAKANQTLHRLTTQPDDPGPDPDGDRPFDYRDDGRARRTIAGLLIAGAAIAAGIIALALS